VFIIFKKNGVECQFSKLGCAEFSLIKTRECQCNLSYLLLFVQSE
jgi:hypothetical protein